MLISGARVRVPPGPPLIWCLQVKEGSIAHVNHASSTLYHAGMAGSEKYVGFCTRCNEQIGSFEGLEACPRCGTRGVPCDYGNQVDVSVNTHELRVLCMWAENWAYSKEDVDEDVVYAIARRLRAQLGSKDVPLTMADEFRGLKEAGYDFETNHPSGQRP